MDAMSAFAVSTSNATKSILPRGVINAPVFGTQNIDGFWPPALVAGHTQPDIRLVAPTPSGDLFVHAKDLLFEATATK
jgi:hypothetical protein